MTLKEHAEDVGLNAGRPVVIEGGIDLKKPLKPYIHKHQKHFDCSFLNHPIFCRQTANGIAHAIAIYFAKLKSSGGRDRKIPPWHRIPKFFKWLIKEFESEAAPPYLIRVRECLSTGEKPAQADWQRVMDDFRSAVTRPAEKNPFCQTDNNGSRNGYVTSVRSICNECFKRGILPEFKLRNFRRKNLGGSRPLLGDAPNKKLDEKKVKSLLGSVLDTPESGFDLDDQERRACYTALASTGVDISGLSDIHIVEEIVRVNTERLDEIRRCAESDFLEAWETYQEAQNLIAGCDLSYEEDMRGPLNDLLEGLASGRKPQSLWSTAHPFREMFQGAMKVGEVEVNRSRRNGVRGDQIGYKRYKQARHLRVPLEESVVKARFLTLVDGRYGVPFPHHVSYINSIIMGLYHRNFNLPNLPKLSLEASLAATIDAILAAQLILLVDTGLNIAVVDDLDVDCVKDTEAPDLKHICGWKDRAGGKVVDKNVRLNDSRHRLNAVEVVRMVKEMAHRWRELAVRGGHDLLNVKLHEPDLAKKLFIRSLYAECGKKNEGITLVAGLHGTRTVAFKRFLQRHPSLSDYKLTPSSIRPTVKILSFYNGGMDIEAAKRDLRHVSTQTSSGYVMRTMTKVAMEKKIREFQNAYEAMMICNIDRAADKLGYTPEEFAEMMEKARTGFGAVCEKLIKDKDGQKASDHKGDCDPYDDCPKCSLAKLFPTSEGNLVDAFLLNRYLTKNKEKLEAITPDRWNEVHVRWLAITRGMIVKAKSDPRVNKTIYKQAQIRAEELGSAYYPPIL